ncbi:glycosyltransferase family 2 protein [Mariniflexile sp.]|uniref:glycosyltransferase family 2 protein n=1 Tax=Mariniflexile sp. TaxID=1979402 RepID=UPI0040476411
MKLNLVSIIVPCYNQAQYLDEALESVLSQTYENWECIIVDDGSPDNTNEIVQKWVEKEARFIYLKKENGGLSSARNAGISKANGEFILPLDADDKIGADYVTLAIEAFELDTSLKVVYCQAKMFGIEESIVGLKPFSLYDLSKKNMIFCSALYRKKEWEIVKGYDDRMIYGLEDWEFWIAILKNGGGVKCLDYLGFYYRIKPNSMLKELNKKRENLMLQYISVKHADFFVKHLGSSIELYNHLEITKNIYRRKIKSKKFAIDVFCNTFFGFTIFKKL